MLKATEKKRGYKIKGAKSGGVMNSNSKKSTVAKSSGKSYNGNTDQYRVMWTIEEGVLTDRDVSIFYDLIGDKKRGLYFPTTFEGETIFEIDNKLIYADTDYFYPSISKVVSFEFDNEDVQKYCMEVVITNEENGYEIGENIEIAEALSGEGTISSTDFIDSKAYRREKNGRGKGSGSGTPNSRSGKNVLKSKPEAGTEPNKSTSASTAVVTNRFEIDKEGQAKLDELVKKYGAMKKGVAPTRDVTLPKRTEDDRYVRQTTRTAIESDRISDEVARDLVEAIANNDEWATSDKRKTA